MPTLFLKLTKIWQRENGKFVDFSATFRFVDDPARNAFEYLQITAWAVATRCYISDVSSQWEWAIFDPRRLRHNFKSGGTNMTASEASRKFFGLYPHNNLLQNVLVFSSLSRPFVLMASMEMHCGITHATVVSQLLYASPAWWGYLKVKADERNRLQSIIAKAVRYGYLPRFFSTLDELREDNDEKLFFSARYNPFHVLHRLLPQSKNVSYNVRQRIHNLTLPTDVNAVMKQNFVYRMLFTDIYWFASAQL